jgi:hypothetical protein
LAGFDGSPWAAIALIGHGIISSAAAAAVRQVGNMRAADDRRHMVLRQTSIHGYSLNLPSRNPHWMRRLSKRFRKSLGNVWGPGVI